MPCKFDELCRYLEQQVLRMKLLYQRHHQYIQIPEMRPGQRIIITELKNYVTRLHAFQASALCFLCQEGTYWPEERTWRYATGIRPGSVFVPYYYWFCKKKNLLRCLSYKTSVFLWCFWRPEQSFCIAGPSVKGAGNDETYDIRSSSCVQVVQVTSRKIWIFLLHLCCSVLYLSVLTFDWSMSNLSSWLLVCATFFPICKSWTWLECVCLLASVCRKYADSPRRRRG